MTEEKRTAELDKLEKALDGALREALTGRAAELFWALDNLRVARDLAEGVIVKVDPDAPDFEDIGQFWSESVAQGYELLGIERPAGMMFA